MFEMANYGCLHVGGDLWIIIRRDSDVD